MQKNILCPCGKNIQYDYIVKNISDKNTIAYKAIIPAFNGIVFGENLAELEDGIAFAIEEEIKERKRKKLPIPKSDKEVEYSGKLLLRINPEFHERLALSAKASGKSINSYIKEKIML